MEMEDLKDTTKADFEIAKNHVLTFGKYKGETIDKIAFTDEGLKYLDWVRGVKAGEREDRIMISRYLSDKSIAAELRAIT